LIYEYIYPIEKGYLNDMKCVLIILLIFSSISLHGMDVSLQKKDTSITHVIQKDPEVFYDNLQVKASRNQITRWLYKKVIRNTDVPDFADTQSYDYYQAYANKIIGSIRIKSLAVFGPDFNDTAQVTDLWVEKVANKLHSNSNLSVIRKNLWIKEGEALDPNLIMDNERLLRSLPYLKDVRIIVKPRDLNKDIVDILILTQDVFSLGITGEIGNASRGEIGIYDKNIFGVGHELGASFVGSTDQTPHSGFETYYTINNINGKFIDISGGYANTFRRESSNITLKRDFLRPQSVYAGGITAYRSFRDDRIFLNDNVVSEKTLNYSLLDGWYGRKLRFGSMKSNSRFLMTLSGRIRYTSFYDRPVSESENDHYFANSTFYLGSLSFSHLSYVRDYLIYSYGIVEDIPKGYLHELVFGYDHNEFGDRGYSHIFLSTGNLFRHRPFYFYTSVGAGSYWKTSGMEQGMVDLKINFISPLFDLWNVKVRQFIKMNYTLGVDRFDLENLLLKTNEGIRGFESRIEKGKQRLTLNVENVFFQRKSILNFQSALYSFLDVGIVGPSNESIFKQDYFAGIGVGLRIRSENLIFKTIQFRLAYYPNFPKDVSPIGVIFDEVPKSRFYSFQPRGPEPMRFE